MALIDLTTGETECWENLSKGHRSILKKFIGSAGCRYVNHGNSPLRFDSFCKAASAITRFSEDNLSYLYALYREGHMDFSNLTYEGETIASALFLKYGGTVQYYAAERFSEGDIPAHHLLLWEAMKRYRREGYKIMDLGVFSYSPQLNYIPSEKAGTISVFKRGFASRVAPFLIGEKYYNRAYFEEEYGARISNYKETIGK
jgi:hypothetical protein